MSSSKESVSEFIQDTFRPLVAILCSEQVEKHCLKNNLSFVKLIQPFCTINSEAHIKDVNNALQPVKNLKIICHDLNESSVSSLHSKKKLSDIVSNSYLLDNQQHGIQQNIPLNYNSILQLASQSPRKTPWYESYRKYFLESMPLSDHEYLRHYVSCIIAVSTSEPDPMERLNRMVQSLQQPHGTSLAPSNLSSSTLLQDAKWFIPNFLKFYVLVHDVSEQDDRKAESVYQSIKEKYGIQFCHLLHINSHQHARSNDHTENSFAKDSDNVGVENPWLRYAANQQDLDKLKQTPRINTSQTASSLDSVMAGSISTISQTSFDHPLALDHLSVNDEDDDAIKTRSSDLPQLLTFSHSSSTTFVSEPSKSLGCCLTLSDVDRLKIFVGEYVVHALFPWVEKTLKTLNDQSSARKGIKGSLFSASKWFGRTRPANQSVNSSSVVYSSDSPEMQLRRLADLSFLFQLYELAYQTYHTIKKDFNNDGAWMHHAGALEIACLSVYLQGSSSSRPYPSHYMESSIKHYFSNSRSMNFATRATMLSTEILKSKNLYLEAANQFMTITSEDSDLLSALFLEQTAHCSLNMKVRMVRKYAFHMVLGGHRFNKCGQKKHALRCYAQALDVFHEKEWSMAEDHINLTIGSLAYNIRQLPLAISAFLHILTPRSKQTAIQQAAFFTQYLNIHKQQMSMIPAEDERKRQMEMLPFPVVDRKSIKVFNHFYPVDYNVLQDGRVAASGVSLDDDDEDKSLTFSLLEEKLVGFANHDISTSTFFKPTIFCHTQHTDNSANVLAIVNEPLLIEVKLENPLKIPLLFHKVHLLWRFAPSSNTDVDAFVERNEDCSFVSNESAFLEKVDMELHEFIEFQTLSEFHLNGSEIKKLQLSLTCKKQGVVQITGLAFQLTGQLLSSSMANGVVTNEENISTVTSTIEDQHHNIQSNASSGTLSHSFNHSVPGMVELVARGNRLNVTKEDKMNVRYAIDRRLHIEVFPVGFRMEMFLHNFPTSLLCGEVVECMIEFSNCGQQHVTSLLMICTPHEIMSFSGNINNKKGIVEIPLPVGGLVPGQKVMTALKVQCPERSGLHDVNILVYYTSDGDKPCSKFKYRLIRHSTSIKSESSVIIASHCFPSHLSPNLDADTSIVDNNINISLQVDNINMDYDISIVKLLCMSTNWSLCMQKKVNESKRKGAELNIKPGESHLLTLQASRRLQKNYSLSKISFSDENILIENYDSLVQILKLRPNNECEISNSYNKMFEMKLDLVIIWKAISISDPSKFSRFGHHIIAFNKLNEKAESLPVPRDSPLVPQIKFTTQPLESCESESFNIHEKILSQLVKTLIIFPLKFSHDFSSKRICIIPVKVIVSNCSNIDVFVKLETFGSTAKSRHDDEAHLSANQCTISRHLWIGQATTFHVVSSNQSMTINLKAKILEPGICDLSCIRTFASPYEPDFNDSDHLGKAFSKFCSGELISHAQLRPPPSLVTVSDLRIIE